MATTRHSQLHKLDFKEAIVQKGASTDALLKRLKTLNGKLAVLEQDHVDVKSLDKVRKQLIDDVVLHHKDKGVKAYAAVCIADVLRLYAPEAPYTADEIRDIFMFFAEQLNKGLRPTRVTKSKAADAAQSQLPGGRVTELPYYDQYCHLLENLATVKSVVLICDAPDADELIASYFDHFVEIVRPDMSKGTVRHMAEILVTIIEESEGPVPSGVMDCIVSQFETYASKPETPSFQLIVEVCNRTADRLQRAIFAHVSEIQIERGRDPSQEDLKALSESHALLLSFFRYAPGLLLNVVPLLEENLRAADEVPLRQLSTKTLGAMFGERPVVSSGMFDVARSYPSTWRAWLGRKVDKALPVRLAWVEAAKGILTNHPEIRQELENELVDRTEDSDERVRAAICRTIGQLDYTTALHHVSSNLLRAIGARVSDKKSSVHSEAITALARLWSLAYSEIEADDPEAVEQFGWIPEAMLHASRRASPELRSHLITSVKQTILPLPASTDDEQAWVDRFLLVAGHVDESALEALDSMTGLMGFAKGSSPWRAFADTLDEFNGGIMEADEKQIKQKLDFITNAVSVTFFGDAEKARRDLMAFANNNDRRLFGLLRRVADPQSELYVIVKARNEFLRKVEQSYTSLLATARVLIDSAAWNIINHSSISGLIKRLQRPDGPQGERATALAARYLALIAKECAPMYKSHVPELVVTIHDKKRHKLVEVAFQALAAVCKWDRDSAPKDAKTASRASQVSRTGTPRQAKFAARFYAYSQPIGETSQLIQAIADSLVDASEDLQEKDGGKLLALLRSCAELALSAPTAFKEREKDIIDIILHKVIYAPTGQEDDDMGEDKWEDEEKLSVLERAKIIGLRVMTHVMLGYARHDDAVVLAQSTFILLFTILKNEGQIIGDDDERFDADQKQLAATNESGPAKCHLRLRAALCLLKLANVRAFDKQMTAQFSAFTAVVQDANYTVRHKFLRKLAAVLPTRRLTPKWTVLPLLVAQDPEQENLDLARNVLMLVVRACENLKSEEKIDRVELPLARLLHALASDPDLIILTLKDVAQFIDLFLDVVATRENVSLLYNIVAKLKTVKIKGVEEPVRERTQSPKRADEGDPPMDVPQESSSRLYMMSELAQHMIRNRAAQHQWPVAVYPGKVRLPSDIFHNLHDVQAVKAVTSHTYLPEGALDTLKSAGGKRTGAPRRERIHAGPTERKRRPKAEGGAPRKKRRVSRSDADSDDDEEESDSDDDDDSELTSPSDAETADEEEPEEDTAVGRRGERRSAKTKANRAVTKKSRKSKK
ncbi:Sister chromatid cohesion protein pds5 [Cryptotrichosporon argae]